MDSVTASRPAGGRPSFRARRFLGLALAFPLATALAPAAFAVDPLTVSTPYPSVAVQPGADVSFPLTVTTDVPRNVDLTVDGTPAGGTARITGGGFTVDGVMTTDKPATATLDVTLPADATGDITMTVHAKAGIYSSDLQLKMRIEGGAGGTIAFDQPTGQKTSAGGSLTYNLTIHNNTPRDTTFTFSTQGPDGWQVAALPGGSSQATGIKVSAGTSGSVTVNIAVPSTAAAGDFQVGVLAAADGSVQPDPVALPVTITGSYSMTMAPTSDENLSMVAQAGAAKQYTWVVTNTGSGALTNIAITATPPSGWTATLDTPKIAQLDPGKAQNVTATVTPASNAVAGDYKLSFAANTTAAASVPAASDSETVRVTVQVGLNWLVVGGAIIALVLIGLSWLFGRFGRR